jgi:hypothetical protein
LAVQIHNWLNELLGETGYGKTGNSNNPAARYFVVPNNKNPKLLFPYLLNNTGLSNSFDLYPVLTPKHYLKKNMMLLMYRFRSILPAAFNMSIGVEGFARDIYQKTSDCRENDQKVAFCSIRTGSEGKGKKLIFQFLDANGKLISYIKLGDKKYRGKWLDNESDSLKYLNETCKDLITVPEIIGYKRTSSFAALEISPIKSFHYYPQISYQHLSGKLAQLANRTRSESCYDLEKQTQFLQKHIEQKALADYIMGHLEFANKNNSVWALAHRDMPAWNVLSNDKNEIAILDWEFAQQGHNPFQDLFHYKIHTQIHNSGKTPEKIAHSFLTNASINKTIRQFGKKAGITDSNIIFSLFIQYLWDWYQLERNNAQSEDQGNQYFRILKHLKNYENSNQYFI